MIATALILGATLLVGATLIAKYWNRVIDIMKKAIQKIQIMIAGTVMGSTVFIRKLGDMFQNRTKHYSKSYMGKWEETIVSYEQTEEEIPEEYRVCVHDNHEYDLTMQLELQLKGNG